MVFRAKIADGKSKAMLKNDASPSPIRYIPDSRAKSDSGPGARVMQHPRIEHTCTADLYEPTAANSGSASICTFNFGQDCSWRPSRHHSHMHRTELKHSHKTIHQGMVTLHTSTAGKKEISVCVYVSRLNGHDRQIEALSFSIL
ncbi:unnamed protein product [Leuciscus chuanchicus]